MYKADLTHPAQMLQDKLHQLYTLNRAKAIDLSFRPPYLNLLEKFGNPHLDLPPVIHVAGTNGKGSTIAILRSVLEAYGLKVHTYTSPHLYRFNERIVLAGKPIDDVMLESLIDEALLLNDDGAVTFFEVTTAMAFAAFSRVPADVVLLEVGMGGRLDCTNVVPKPLACLIQTISRDHMEHLGDDLLQIAAEKAGIIKSGVPCVIAPQMDMGAVLPVFEKKAQEAGAALSLFGQDWCCEADQDGLVFIIDGARYNFPRPALHGAHQVGNAGTALATLYGLRDSFGWDEDAIRTGLSSVRWAGRMEQVSATPEIWYDGGHNDSAALALAAQMEIWRNEEPKDLHLVLAMKADKDPALFLEPLLPYISGISVIPLEGVGSCVDAAQIREICASFPALMVDEKSDVKSALDRHSNAQNRILICGSLYLASQIP